MASNHPPLNELTNLPDLPEDMFWKIEEFDDIVRAVHGPGVTIKIVQKTTSTERLELTFVSKRLYVAIHDLTLDHIYEAVIDLMKDFEKKVHEEYAAEVNRNRFIGSFPPKKLEYIYVEY